MAPMLRPLLSRRRVRLACLVFLMLWVAAPDFASDRFAVVAPGVEAIPGPDAVLPTDAGEIRIRLSGDAALATPLRIWLDGYEVTPAIEREGSAVRLPLPRGYAPGRHGVRVDLPKLTGGTRSVTWNFVAPSAPVEAVQTDRLQLSTNLGKRTLYDGDLVEVTLRGPAQGRAAVSIGDRIRFPLTEMSGGLYSGVREIRTTDYLPSGHLTATLALPGGRVLSVTAPQIVRVFGQFFTIHILSPREGEVVGWNVAIKGHTRPGTRITLTPQLGGPDQSQTVLGGSPGQVGATPRNLGSIEVVADARGHFELKFGFPIHMFAVRYSFMATGFAPNGEQAIPATFSVVLGKKK